MTHTPETAQKDPWYAIFGGRFPGDQPFFYDPNEFDWVAVFESQWETIRDELFALTQIEPERVKPYDFNHAMSFPPLHWKTMGLKFWGIRIHKNLDRCPTLAGILEARPEITSLSLSILEPHSNINPHQGDTDAVYRCHLGLKVPAPLPDCGFQVGKDIRSWEEGKILVFCDAQTHTAWNQTDERRAVVIFDVMRPEFQNRTRGICTHVMASMIIQKMYSNSAWLRQRRAWVKRWLYTGLRLGFYAYIPYKNKFGARR
ncbi:aspartyl/asparaginyl beta-hydroxylase domain-containing protein [Yoonia maritima]|uniref:aspartyl/asparaginyl beta-hydroxylase domain-containing protein n=1 Tax=Yoonia maritima TaxID=1435347 RepID=UPI0013A649D2|nr:aspartyl/asparaginyl beta-hydroxylase domain-containing protein [Yoonia maritima]